MNGESPWYCRYFVCVHAGIVSMCFFEAPMTHVDGVYLMNSAVMHYIYCGGTVHDAIVPYISPAVASSMKPTVISDAGVVTYAGGDNEPVFGPSQLFHQAVDTYMTATAEQRILAASAAPFRLPATLVGEFAAPSIDIDIATPTSRASLHNDTTANSMLIHVAAKVRELEAQHDNLAARVAVLESKLPGKETAFWPSRGSIVIFMYSGAGAVVC
jgi:hypothetical protein